MKYLHGGLLVVAILLASCSSPEEKAKKVLSEKGIPVLVDAYIEQVVGGDARNVQLLLDAGIPVDSMDEGGASALAKAAAAGQIAVVNVLLSAGADINKRDQEGNTPLIRAAAAGKKEVAVKLIQAGANTGAVNKMGASVLTTAIGKKNWPMVISLGRAGVNVDVIVEDGRTLLLEKIIKGDASSELVETLVAAGADINRADNSGQTPFMAAVVQNKPKFVALMTKKGANVNDLLFDNRTRPALLEAIEHKNAEMVRVLIEAGADVLYKDQELMNSCLHRAVSLQQKEIVQMLVKAGADVNAQNIFRETPLFKATVEPKGINLGIAEVLVLAKADTNALVTENGQTLLHVAVMRNETLSGSLRFLLGKGADPQVYDNDGQTPLTLAVKNNKLEAVEDLIDGGADVNFPAMTGKKPLAIAEELDVYKIAGKLRRAGAKEE